MDLVHPGTTAQDVPVLIGNLPLGKQEVGLILCPFRNVTGGRKPVLPSDTWRPSGRSESFKLHNIPDITVNIFTIYSPSVFPLPDVSWSFYNYYYTIIIYGNNKSRTGSEVTGVHKC